jgi:hypothetical protein
MKMAATFEWSESNLVGEVITDDIANVNFGSVDEVEIVTATNPVIAGENSFSKYIRAKFTGVFTEISNMKFWKSSGALKTEEVIRAAANVAYATPSAVDTEDDDVPTSEGEALVIKSAEGADTIENGASGVSGYSGYIRLQLQTGEGIPVGAVNQKEFTLQYDEV